MRSELRNVPAVVLAELPERLNLRKGISRTRLVNMPANPRTLDELHQIPHEFQLTLAGDNFQLYDSIDDENSNCGRVIIYGTNENLRHLFRTNIWFVDGTFSCAPSIFFQLFAILGGVHQPGTAGRQPQIIGLPFLYALLEDKTEASYTKVFEVLLDRARQLEIQINVHHNLAIMSDFEMAILNSAKNIVHEDSVRCCFFHLGQSVYRQVQNKGLQAQYTNVADARLKIATHMMLALAFVPVERVHEYFRLLSNEIPEDLLPVYEYFQQTYVCGKTATGRAGRPRHVPPRYSPALWNQYNAVLQGTARTNNISEGWHNRFQVVVGKHHPSLYTFLTELQKEQADTEILLRQLQSGQKVRKSTDPKRKKREERLYNVVSTYHTYVQNNDIITYLKNVGYNIRL